MKSSPPHSRHNPTYKFDLLLSDTNSYGSNRFSLIIRQNKRLEVHLLDFTALKSSNSARIMWRTENEQDYTTFTVERSTDNGETFNALGALTSSNAGTYDFTDTNPVLLSDKYRLKLVDLNGTITYSNIVTITYGNMSNTASNSNISVYPNPSRSTINLSIAPVIISNPLDGTGQSSLDRVVEQPSVTNYDITIISSTGAVIKTVTTNHTDWQTDIGSLVPGTYFIQVINSNSKSVVGKSAFIKL